MKFVLTVTRGIFMAGLWDIHHENIKADIKNNEIFVCVLAIPFALCALVIVAVIVVAFIVLPHFYKIDDLSVLATVVSVLAITVSLLALVGSLMCQAIIGHYQMLIPLRESIIRQKQDELNDVKERIKLFYLPLKDLLTTYDENIVSKTKKRKINEINGHIHLAKPCIRDAFKTCIKSNDEANRESSILLGLVNGEIDHLQNRFMELNMELNR
jgi:hypothetical protein